MENIKNIGQKIKELRKRRKITLKELSGQTGLSIGYLSNLEHNLCSPTLENMDRICESLNTSIGELLSNNAQERFIVRKGEREVVLDEECKMRMEGIDFGITENHYLYITLPPDVPFNGMLWKHVFDEVGTVLEGELTIKLKDTVYRLAAGDSILIRAQERHSLYNTSKEQCVSFWIQHKEELKIEK